MDSFDGGYTTKNTKGAHALTKVGAALRQEDRGATLTLLASRLVGPRGACKEGGVSRTELDSYVREVIAKSEEIGGGALRDNLADLMTLVFEAGDVREGHGERTVFVWLFLAAFRIQPRTMIRLLRVVPHYCCWRTLALLYDQAAKDSGNAEPDERVALDSLRAGIAALWARQLLIDSARVAQYEAARDGVKLVVDASEVAQKVIAPAIVVADIEAARVAAAASSSIGAETAGAAVTTAGAIIMPAPQKHTSPHVPLPTLSLAGKWAPRVGGAFDKSSGLAHHIIDAIDAIRTHAGGVKVHYHRPGRAAGPAADSAAQTIAAETVTASAAAAEASSGGTGSSASNCMPQPMDEDDWEEAEDDSALTSPTPAAGSSPVDLAHVKLPLVAEAVVGLPSFARGAKGAVAAAIAVRERTPPQPAPASSKQTQWRVHSRYPPQSDVAESAALAKPTANASKQKSHELNFREMSYRRLLTSLRRVLDITEVKMSARAWATIVPEHVGSLANKKYAAALQNIVPERQHPRSSSRDKGVRGGVDTTGLMPGEQRSKNPDRVACASGVMAAALRSLDAGAVGGSKRIKGARNQPHELVAAYFDDCGDKGYMRGLRRGAAAGPDLLIEAMWADLEGQLRAKAKLPFAVSIVDVSGSMEGLPMQVAIAMGLVVARLQPVDSPWRHRMLTFDSEPTWVDISDCGTLQSMVSKARAAPWGGSTHFGKAMRLMLDHARAHNIPAAAMPKSLFCFSDMEFDQAASGAAYYGGSNAWAGNVYGILDPSQAQCRGGTQDVEVEEEGPFHVAGNDVRAAFREAGYEPPQLIFWNLRADGPPTFQAETSTPGVALMSGFSAECLRQLCEEGAFPPPPPLQSAHDDDEDSEEAPASAMHHMSTAHLWREDAASLHGDGPDAALDTGVGDDHCAAATAVNSAPPLPPTNKRTAWDVLLEKLQSERYDRVRAVIARAGEGALHGYEWAPNRLGDASEEAQAPAGAVSGPGSKQPRRLSVGRCGDGSRRGHSLRHPGGTKRKRERY